MANTIIVYDNNDTRLGFFFELCYQNLNDYLKSISVEPTTLTSLILNDLAVYSKIKKYDKFVFCAYSHGSEEALLKSGKVPYVSVALSGDKFKNSMLYTFSCSSGKNLGISLNCICFFGYNKTIYIWSTYVKPFVECANYGLVIFYHGVNSSSIYELMIKKYNQEIDELYKTDFLIASILMDNRDSLVFHGNSIDVNYFK